MFRPSKDKIDDIYASLQAYFKIEYGGELKNLGIELDRLQDGLIHIIQTYLNQMIINMIPDMDNSGAKPNPVVKSPPTKKWSSSKKK